MPRHGWVGIGLVAVFWVLNWSLPGLRSHWAFFPMWLGYSLAIDGFVVLRKGHSMLSRSPAGFALLFLLSIPGWWLFEAINLRTRNWSYAGAEFFSDLEYFLLCSLSFSTVMPAVFGTAELIGTGRWLQELRPGPRLAPTKTFTWACLSTGLLMFALLLQWPRYFFPFVWGSLFLIVDPINAALGNRSLLHDTARGDWRPVISLPAGCLVCAFFWEMWNFYSYPKWIYQVPLVDWLHIFEMPLLGYLGYIPFSWELFALYHLLVTPFGPKADVLRL